eukprot:1775595-Amphidinium_carterae.1
MGQFLFRAQGLSLTYRRVVLCKWASRKEKFGDCLELKGGVLEEGLLSTQDWPGLKSSAFAKGDSRRANLFDKVTGLLRSGENP